jgi:hypothetical protein
VIPGNVVSSFRQLPGKIETDFEVNET